MFRDRAIETVQAGFTGIGTYNLGGAGTNAQALDQAFGSGGVGFFAVRTATWSKVEFLWGVVTSGSPDTLTRNVLRSFNGTVWGTAAVSWVSGDHPLYVYSVPLGDALASLIKTNAATSRPAWLPQFGMWVDTDTPSATVLTLKFFDGTDDISLGTIDSVANTFAASGNYVPLVGGVTITGDLTMGTAAQILLDDSTVAGTNLPLCFDGDTDTGMVRLAANTAALVAAGSSVLTWSATGANVTGVLNASGDIVPATGLGAIGGLTGSSLKNEASQVVLRRSASPDTYISLSTTDFGVYVNGGAARISISATVLTTTSITINAGNIALQSGASLSHATGGNTVVDTSGHLVGRTYTNAGKPSAASFTGAFIRVSDGTGGSRLHQSNGTNWEYYVPDGTV